ncbi:hypothetical protein GYMLUDRAFT_240887 [Collybiopsis luxurians FD-317 M1]|nr:hypothetical protein GYMLUDRAFT_240887 [Collybiopsis luxurians FD-317 M1]
MPKGQPPKCKRNTAGLKNQQRTVPGNVSSPLLQTNSNVTPLHEADPGKNETVEECWVQEPLTGFAQWFGHEAEDDEEEECKMDDDDWEEEWFDSDELKEKLFHYAAAMDNDVKDEDWFPGHLSEEAKERKQKQRKEHEHKGGSDKLNESQPKEDDCTEDWEDGLNDTAASPSDVHGWAEI